MTEDLTALLVFMAGTLGFVLILAGVFKLVGWVLKVLSRVLVLVGVIIVIIILLQWI